LSFAFVILHYLAYSDTSDCVDSILQNVNDYDFDIIIVDNKSDNNSFEKLNIKYADLENIHFLYSAENSGFAKGNNIGFSYAKNQLHADFIIMINNDTLILQHDFLKKILIIFNEHEPYIIGPDIISTADNRHQNPQRSVCLSKKDIRKLILRNYFFIVIITLKIEWLVKYVYNFFKGILKIHSITNNEAETNNWMTLQENVELHGACLIFTPLYIKRYKGLFDETFLFFEENIIYYIATKEKIKLIYHPGLRIYHKEDSSTDLLFNGKDSNQIRLFKFKNVNKSAKILLRLMKNNYLYKSVIEE